MLQEQLATSLFGSVASGEGDPSNTPLGPTTIMISNFMLVIDSFPVA